MRSVLRAALVASALVLPVVPTAAYADAVGSVTVPIGNTGECAYAKTPTVQYNNGDPTMQPGEARVSNCT